MKCPRCGSEMVMDGHRRIDMGMCYECGYIEGRNTGDVNEGKAVTNFERLRGLNFNEAVAFISKGLGIDEAKLVDWMDNAIA